MVIEEHAALDVITKDGSTYAIDESQIIRDSLTTSQSCSSGGGIPAGSCNTGTASVAFHAPSALSYEKLFGAKVKLYVWYGDTSKKQVGVYNVTSTERSYGVYTLSLSDNVYLLDEACYSNDTTTAAQNWLAMQLGEKKVPSVIFNMICNAYNVPHWNASKNEREVPESGIGALSVKVPSDCCTESVKDFANYLAEYLGVIIMPDENGELHFSYMGSRTCPIAIDASNIERNTYQKSPFHVSTSSWRVNHDSGIWTSWSVSGDFPENAAPLSIVVNNNPFWQSVEDGTPESMVRGRTETMLRYMWVAQGKVAYIDNVPQINPFRCTVHVPYYFRAGDRVKIIDPFTSEVYHSYVTDVTWTFRGGQQISCAGEDTRTLSVSTSRNGAKKMSDYSRYLYRKSKSNTGSGDANTYTKAEIDAKDAAVKSAADKAQGTADGAVSVNNTQNSQIAALQKSAHTHKNKSVLDKTEQPYTTAERDKLAGLENYTHPTYTAHTKGFYKFASDGEGHVADAEKVTKEDITALGIPDKDTNTMYRLVQDGITINMLGSDGSSSEVGLKPTITKRLYGWINHEVNTDDTGKILIDAYLGASPVRWDSVLTEPTKVEVGYDVGGRVKTLITDFANDILVHNVVSQNCSTTVTGKQNLVEGNANKVYGNNNLVGGEHNQITEHGCSSLVSGYGLYCDAVNQTVLGRYNAKDAGSNDDAWNSYYGKYVLIIGNGSDSGTGRSNAFAVDWDGNLWCGKDKASLNAQVASKQDKLTAGTNITINGKTISAKDTTYSDATQSTHGLMTAADKKKLDGMDLSKYLPKDGTAKKADCLSTGQLKFGYIYNSTSTATAGKTWARVAYCVVPKGYTTITMAMLVTSGNSGMGLFDIDFRTNANCDGFDYFNVKQVITNFPERVSIDSIKAFAKSTSGGMQYEIWYNIGAIYGTRQFTCLSEQRYNGANSNEWKFEKHTAADFELSPPTDGTEATYSSCGVVSTAETLTDSGWVATTRNTTFTATSTVKCRKYGQLVEVRGDVTFSSTYGSPTVCTLPAGYRPAAVVQTCGYTPSGKIFGIKVDTAGVVSFSSDAAGTFVKSTTYRIDLTYLLG
ncbi:hypothetical protein [Ruminococcus callidus]|uniref:hypothetical protein n=1 Tax=Ruminococcus callidus TaxID=40519 RepID=UPI0035200683